MTGMRHIFPSALILAGGGVATIMHNKIFCASNDFDALCFSEGR